MQRFALAWPPPPLPHLCECNDPQQHYYWPQIKTRLIKSPPPSLVQITCRAKFFHKEFTTDCSCFPSLILFFGKLMYPQNDKLSILEVLEVKAFFAVQPWWTDLLRIFIKLFPQILQCQHLCMVIKKK